MNLFFKKLFLVILFACSSVVYGYEFDDENLALLDVVYNRQNIGAGLDVYLDGDSFYLPLVDLVALLEVDINVTAEGASGRFSSEGKSFSLGQSGGQWQINVGERSLTVADEHVQLFEDLLYVKKEDAESWFGIRFDLDFSNSNLLLEASGDLPFLARLARRNRKIGAQYDFGPATLPEWKQPYQWAEIPSADVRLNYFATRYEDENIKNRNINNLQYAVRTLGDFAAMSTETFFSGVTDKGLNGANFRMDRYDNGRQILNLGLSQVSIGDVLNPALGYSNSASGRGILFGNDVVSGGLSRDVRDIEGDYYPGWEVELYLNTTLIGYQTIGEDGRYRFEDVILFSGDNDFKLKFYGPNGQKDEQVRRIVVGDDINDLGKFRYSVAITQPNRKVIEVSDSKPNEDYRYQATFNSRYLISKNFGLSLGLQQAGRKVPEIEDAADAFEMLDENGQPLSLTPEEIDVEYQDYQYVSFGFQSYFAGLNLSYTSTKELNGAFQHGVNLGGVLGTGMIYQIRASRFDEERGFGGIFYDENDNPQLNSYDVSFNQNLGKHSFILRGASRDYKFTSQFDGRFGYSGQFGPVGFNTVFEYQKQDSSEALDMDDDLNTYESVETLNGASFLSFSKRKASVRLSTAYSMEPESEITAVGLTTAWRIDDKTNLDSSINKNLITDSTFYRLGLSWVMPSFRVSPAIAYSDTGYWQGQVQFAMSLGKRSGRLGNYYDMGSDPTLTQGAVRARLFEDRNRDGKYQLGETLLSGGELKAVQSRRKARSNKAGVAWLESLPPWRLTDIQINDNSIDADYVAMAVDDFSVMPRPGRTIELDLPFNLVGEIDGTVVETDGDFTNEARGVTVLLVDRNDEVVDKDNSDSQGYFNFPRVKPGEYKIRVESRELISIDPRELKIDSSGNYLSGVAVTIKMKEFKDPLGALIGPAPSAAKPPVQEPVEAQEESPPEFNGISAPVVEQVVESEVAVAPIYAVPAVNATDGPAVIADAVDKIEGSEANNKPTQTSDEENYSFWAVQVGSFKNEASAIQLVAKIQNIGLSAKTNLVSLPSGQFYRVFAHGFLDEKSAREAKQELDSTLNVKSIVKKM